MASFGCWEYAIIGYKWILKAPFLANEKYTALKWKYEIKATDADLFVRVDIQTIDVLRWLLANGPE